VAKLTREERGKIARKRLRSVLAKHGIASARTLEQKISDAGPYNQRIDPHILTEERNGLVQGGKLVRVDHINMPWFHLPDTPPSTIQARLDAQLAVYKDLLKGSLRKRMGQTLEIAAFRAMEELDLTFLGRFKDLAKHDDSKLYAKEEPPQHIGKRALPGDERLDFIVQHAEAGHLGLECKNVREWIYPDREEIKELLSKCLTLDCVPVLIARRIPFATHLVFGTCGMIMHQTYNQLLPAADQALADQARLKNLLGFHDIRTGNVPDDRLKNFLGRNMLEVAPDAREKFKEYRDLLEDFVSGAMKYEEFAGRVRRRRRGENEDGEWQEDS
jgi:hypothetical protein